MTFGLRRAEVFGQLFAQLVSKIFNLCRHDPPTSQTDRQTTCDRKTALCNIVHRAVIKWNIVDSWFCPRCRILTNSTKYCSCLTSNWYRYLASSSEHNFVLDSANWSHGMKTRRYP